jgi:hypothetical protein
MFSCGAKSHACIQREAVPRCLVGPIVLYECSRTTRGTFQKRSRARQARRLCIGICATCKRGPCR